MNLVFSSCKNLECKHKNKKTNYQPLKTDLKHKNPLNFTAGYF